MSFWENVDEKQEEFELLDLDFNGTPRTVKISDWENIKEMTFKNADGEPFTRKYILTSRGWLSIDSRRLQKELKKFVGRKGNLVIQRWCEGKDFRSTIYKVELEPKQTSIKKPTKSKIAK